MQQTQLQFFYIRRQELSTSHWGGGMSIQASAKGGVTIAYTIKNKEITFAIARCNPYEHFVRSVGKDTATLKYLRGETTTIPLGSVGAHLRRGSLAYRMGIETILLRHLEGKLYRKNLRPVLKTHVWYSAVS